MTATEQAIAIAELDGFKFTGGDGFIKDGLFYTVDGQAENYESIGIGGEFIPALPDYLHSLDAVVPVIKKQTHNIQLEVAIQIRIQRQKQPEPCGTLHNLEWWMLFAMTATPSQLCEVLLRATGKWKE